MSAESPVDSAKSVIFVLWNIIYFEAKVISIILFCYYYYYEDDDTVILLWYIPALLTWLGLIFSVLSDDYSINDICILFCRVIPAIVVTLLNLRVSNIQCYDTLLRRNCNLWHRNLVVLTTRYSMWPNNEILYCQLKRNENILIYRQ